MERKNRGTYKVNPLLSPKENVIALMKMTFPLETTMAKMTGDLEVKENDIPYWRSRHNDNLRLNNVNAYPASRNRWSECTEIKDFQRVIFQTKTSRSVNYRRDIMRSVPVVKGKISLTKVTRFLTEFAKLHADYEKEQELERIEHEKKEALRKVKEKKLSDLKALAKLPSKKAYIESADYRETCNTYDILVDNINEEQVLAIAKVIREVLAKHKNTEDTDEEEE